MKSRQIRSMVTSEGQLELSLADVEIPAPGPDEVVVRVEASPINPSDLGLLIGPADMSQARLSGCTRQPGPHRPDPAEAGGLAGRSLRPVPGGGQ